MKAGQKKLDAKVRNVLRLIFRTAMNSDKPFGSMNSPEHLAAARRIAGEGIVLLKNEGSLLPIDSARVKRIAVIGENAVKMMTVGGGSSSLKVKNEILPLEGIKARAGSGIDVVYARGYVGDVRDEWDGVTTGQSLGDDRPQETLLAEALDAARMADLVIFFGGLNKGVNQDCEDSDRISLALPYDQDRVIRELAKVNSNLVVVNISGNAVAMPWAEEVPAVVQGWYLGSEAGSALADVLFGDVNPSGKLPFTFPVSLEDVGAHATNTYGTEPGHCYYSEDIFVGYRWTEKKGLAPLFPFGHGLSYTTFAYGKPSADKKTMTADDTISFTVNVKNTGTREGQEVVQLYISDKKSSLPRPVKELKGFQKVFLRPGETKHVSVTLDRDAFQYFSEKKSDWVFESGEFEIWVGASSKDIRLKTKVKM